MISYLKRHKAFKAKQVQVLEIEFRADRVLVSLHEVHYHRKQGYRASQLKQGNSIQSLVETLNKSQGLLVVFHGDRLMEQSLEHRTEPYTLADLENVFEYGSTDDYYFSQHRHAATSDSSASQVLSFIRKTELEPYLKIIEEHKLKVHQVYMGKRPLEAYFKSFEFEEAVYTWKQERLEWKGGQLSLGTKAIQNQEEEDKNHPHSLEDQEQIDANSILALSCAIHQRYSLRDDEIINLDAPFQEQLETHQSHQLIKKLFIAVYPALLLLLLINTFVYAGLFKEEQELDERLASDAYKWTRLEKLEQRQERLKAAYGQGASGIPLSYYADQLGQTCPKSLQFLSLECYPLVEKGLEETYFADELWLEGKVQSASVYKAWIEDLSTLNWLDHLKTSSFETKGEHHYFLLKLSLNTP